MGCATGIVKYLVFLANLIFALAGLALVIIGIMYKLNYSEATNALPKDLGLAPILSIVIGAIVFITAFLGCCGAVKESPCMLTTYAIILLTIFIIQVAIGVYAFLKIKDTNEFHQAVEQSLKKPFDAYNDNKEAKETVDVTQRFLNCCGFQHYNDIAFQNGSLPLSCCKQGVTHHCRSTDYNSFHNKPCSTALTEFLENSSQVVGGVAIGVAVIEFKCCGLNGPLRVLAMDLPASCCSGEVKECSRLDLAHLYTDGCVDKVEQFVYSNSQYVGIALFVIAAIEVIGACFGFCLANTVKNQYRRNLYA